MALSLGLAVLSIGCTWMLWGGGKDKLRDIFSEKSPWLHDLLWNKWYVDEIYDRLIVQPLIQSSRFCWKVIDARVIDGVVNGVGWAARALGFIVSMFQTGTVNMYAFVLTIGALIILGVSVF